MLVLNHFSSAELLLQVSIVGEILPTTFDPKKEPLTLFFPTSAILMVVHLIKKSVEESN